MNTTQRAFDANDTYFLNQELVAMQAKSFEVLRSPFNSEFLIPIYSGDNSGASFHEYKMHDSTGKAGFISSHDNSFPMSNVTRESFISPYVSMGVSHLLTIQDLRAANMALLPYAQAKLDSSVKDVRFAQNHMAFYGSPEHNINGWFNIPNITKTAVTGGTWVSKIGTPDLILKDMHEIINATLINTDGAVRVDTLVMPIAQYALIKTTPRSGTNDTTILEYFLANNPEITVYAANELKGAFQGGTDGMIAYENNPEWFKQLISIDFEAHEVIKVTNGLEMSFETRLGGCVLVYPESQQFRYGI